MQVTVGLGVCLGPGALVPWSRMSGWGWEHLPASALNKVYFFSEAAGIVFRIRLGREGWWFWDRDVMRKGRQ